MAAPTNDDFQEISDLLFRPKERYRSVRATIFLTIDATVAEEANRRFVDWRFAQGNPGMAKLGKPGPPVREDFYREYADTEELYHLWHERPDRWREERSTLGGSVLRCAVTGGEGGPWWVYHPEVAVYRPIAPAGKRPGMDFTFMLDPSEELFYHSLRDDATVHKMGLTTTVAGREAVEVVVGTVSWGYPPIIFHESHAVDGTTDHLLLVDAEVGTILRVAARLEGREFYIAEVTEIAYDEEFPEDTFRLELPGVEFRRVDP